MASREQIETRLLNCSRLVDQAAWNAWKAWAKLQDAESRRAAPRPVESRYNRAYLCTGGRDGQEDRAG